MDVFIARNGSLHGQWTEDQVHALYRAGILLPNDHYWVDGMPAWRTLASADAPRPAPKGPPPLPAAALRATTRLVPKPQDLSPVPAATSRVAPEVISADGGEKPPTLPVIAATKPVSPSPYVYSDPAKKILQLLSPETPESKKRELQARSDFSKVSWLVPEGRTTPFGVAPPPIPPSSAADASLDAEKNGAGARGRRRKLSSQSLWAVGAWCLVVALVAAFIIAGRRDHAHASGGSGQPTFTEVQALRSGHVFFDPASTDAAAAKLEAGLNEQTGLDRTKNEISADLLREIAARIRLCEKNERPLADLGMDPSKMISLKALDARRAAVVSAQEAVSDMVDFLDNLDASARAMLAAKSVGHADSNDYVSYLNEAGKRTQLLAYWQQESAYLAGLLANLDLLKTNWGQWRVDSNGSLAFDDPAAAAKYAGIENKSQAALSAERAAQDDAAGL